MTPAKKRALEFARLVRVVESEWSAHRAECSGSRVIEKDGGFCGAICMHQSHYECVDAYVLEAMATTEAER